MSWNSCMISWIFLKWNSAPLHLYKLHNNARKLQWQYWISNSSSFCYLFISFPLKKYFITNLRSTGMIPSTASRYQRIKQCLEDDTTLVYLHLVAYLAASLSQFMHLFQTDSPLVHVLYDKVNELTRTFLRKFLKPDVVDGKEGADLIAVDCEKADNWLPRNKMEVGSGTKRVLASKPDDKKKTVRLAFRKCLKTIATYLKDHLPLNNVILWDLQRIREAVPIPTSVIPTVPIPTGAIPTSAIPTSTPVQKPRGPHL